MKTKKRILAYLLTLTLAMTSLPTQLFAQTTKEVPLPMSALLDTQTTTPGAIQINPKKYVGDGYEVEFKVTNQWPGAFNGEFVLTNTSGKPLENWTLKFDFEHEITNMWNAQILTHENNSYVIKNMGWNQDIEPGSSMTIGFQANGEGTINTPSKYNLDMEEQVASDVDYTIGYKLTNNWNTGFNGEISITNLSKAPIEDWSLAFDFEANINNLWTATIVEHIDNHYVIKNKGYNANIAPGQTLTLGFGGDNLKDSTIEPSNYKLSYIGSVKDKEDIDYELDTDNDDLPDYYENILGTDPLNADTDGDGLPDGYEYWELMTDPLIQDSDGNNISDADEDFDEDGLTNKDEFLLDTDPHNNDTDEDGLPDGGEVNKFNTNPLVYDQIDENLDTDQDGLVDGLEMRLGTELNNPDTDGDGLLDGYEVFKIGTNPLELDSDNNGIDDGDEDFDSDGICNFEEQRLGTNPQLKDTDSDNLSDGDEVNQYHTNPLVYDTDGDTIGDGDEIKLGLNPLAASTNGVPDNEYMIEQTVSEEVLKYINTEENDYTLSINVKASGNAQDNIMVSTSQYNNIVGVNNAIVGKTISVDYFTGKIEEGKLSFKLDQKVIEEASEEGLQNSEVVGLKKFYVFNFNEELNMLVPVPTTYDETTQTLVSDLIGNGTYCVMNVEEWLVNIGALENTQSTIDYTYDKVSLLAKDEINSKDISSLETIANNDLLRTSNKKSNKVDLAFVVDTGYTMEKKLNTVKGSIREIVRLLREDYHLDVEVSIIDFKDINAMSPDSAIRINGNRPTIAEGNRDLSFTGDADELERIIDGLDAFGGYDVDISGTPLAGLGYVTTLPFRSNAGKFAFLITDKSYSISNCHGYTNLYAMIEDLNNQGVNLAISYMTHQTPQGSLPDQTATYYRRWLNRINGIYIPMKDLDVSEYEFAEFVATNLIGEKNFQILKSTNLDKVELNGPLTKGGSTNSDKDTLTDSQEVNWDLITFENGELKLPTLSYLWQWPGAVYDIKLIENMPWFATSQEQVILPIVSDPTSDDGDNDGLRDDEDKYPLKDTFKEAWYRINTDGKEVYFGQIKFGEENLRALVFENGASRPQVYAYQNYTWIKTNEEIDLHKDGKKVQIKDEKLLVENLDQTIVFDMMELVDATSETVEEYYEYYEVAENKRLFELGVDMGIIDSYFLDIDDTLEIDYLLQAAATHTTTNIMPLIVIPQGNKIKQFMMLAQGTNEEELEQNRSYLEGKVTAEQAMSAIFFGQALYEGGIGIVRLVKSGWKFGKGVLSAPATAGLSLTMSISSVSEISGSLCMIQSGVVDFKRHENADKHQKEDLGKLESLTNTGDSLWKPATKEKDLWSKGKLKEHYEKHGIPEFGAKSSKEYSDMACEFGTRNSDNIIEVIEGPYVYRYEPSTNIIFVGTLKGGKIKSFYKWDGRPNDLVIETLKRLEKL